MSEGNGNAAPKEEPFGGNGPQNLSPQLLQQAWNMTAILAYQRRGASADGAMDGAVKEA